MKVPEAVGGKTVFGQLTVANAAQVGFVTAYGCADGVPRDRGGNINKSDLNYNGPTSPVASNRLIVKADNNGEICLYSSGTVEIIVDINGVTDTGITAIPNQRTDTRTLHDCDTVPTGAVKVSVETDLPRSDPHIRLSVCGIHAAAAAMSGGPRDVVLMAYVNRERLVERVAEFTGSPIEQVRQMFTTSGAVAFGDAAIAYNVSQDMDKGFGDGFIFNVGAHEWYHNFQMHTFIRGGLPSPVDRFLLTEPVWLVEASAQWFGLELATMYGFGDYPQSERYKGARFEASKFTGLKQWETGGVPAYNLLPFIGDVLVEESSPTAFLRTYWEARAVTTEPWQTTFASVFKITVPEFYAKVSQRMRDIAS